MKKACLFIEYNLNNKIFDLDDKTVNRDNFAYSFYLLKKNFLDYNFDLSTKDINSIEDSSIILYFDMPKKMPEQKDIHKSYLIINECEIIVPQNWNIDNHKYFNKIFTWNDKFVDNKKYFKLNFSHLIPKIINKDLSKKEKLCTLISGNKSVNAPLELYSERKKAIRWFEKYHPQDFDFYGMGWERGEYTGPKFLKHLNKYGLFNKKFPSYQGIVENKKNILEKYKFAICYENAKDIP